MRLVSVLSLGAFLLGATVAGAQDVRYNFDKSANFSQFKTYKWVTIKDAARLPDLTEKQVIQAIDAELATKGLQKVEGDNADLLIAYQAAIQKEKEFTSYNSGWGYGPGWHGGGWYGGAGGITTGQTSTILIGQLVLDMYSSAGKDLVWRGVVSKTLDTDAKPEKQQKNLAKAVKKLLKNYPPTTNKTS